MFVEFEGMSNHWISPQIAMLTSPEGYTVFCINHTINKTPSSQLLNQMLQIQRSFPTFFGWPVVTELDPQPAGIRHPFEKPHQSPT